MSDDNLNGPPSIPAEQRLAINLIVDVNEAEPGRMDIYNIGQDTAPTTLVIPQDQVGKVHLDVGDAVSIMRVSRTHMIIKLLATNAPR